MFKSHYVLALGIWIALSLPTLAQVFDPGPSDPALFDTVINLPADPNIGDGGAIDNLTQLNVADGGSVGVDFTANTGSEVNVLGGGVIAPGFEAAFGSEVNIVGGAVGRSFDAQPNSLVRLSAGTVGPDFNVIAGSELEVIGGEFRLNGEEFASSVLTLNPDDIFSGVLTDGSVFAFSPIAGDLLIAETITSAPVPAFDPTPRVITTDVSNGPSGLRNGQLLTLQDGGNLGENFTVLDSTLNVEGGRVGGGAEIFNGTVNISGGMIEELDAYQESVVTMSGGTVTGNAGIRGSLVMSGGSVVGNLGATEATVTGGTVERFSAGTASISGGQFGRVEGGGQIHISGGVVDDMQVTFGGEVSVTDGQIGTITSRDSQVNISGGTIHGTFRAERFSQINITSGALGNFFFDQESTVALSGGTVGRVFASGFLSGNPAEAFELIGGEFRLNSMEVSPGELTVSLGDLLTGTLADGSTFVFDLDGGRDSLRGVTLTSAPLPELDTTPRIVDTPLLNGPYGLREGQSLTVESGGDLRNNFAVIGASLTMNGGTAGTRLEVVDGLVNLHGGTIGSEFSLYAGAVANIRGGTIDTGIKAFLDSSVNLFGTEFLVDGVPIDSLDVGESLTITDREITLSGRLADGSPFEFELNSGLRAEFSSLDYFDAGATLTVTLVPEPTAICLVLGGIMGLCVRSRDGHREVPAGRLAECQCAMVVDPSRYKRRQIGRAEVVLGQSG